MIETYSDCTTVALALGRELLAQQRGDRPAKPAKDKYAAFYKSRAWRAARYRFMSAQSKPLRCAACGATARETRLAVDHIEPLRTNWDRRLDQTNFQMLCAGNGGCGANLAKGSSDTTDFRTAA